MASAIDDNGFLEFAQDDNMIRRLNDLNIEWDEQTIDLAAVDVDDNKYQTRFDAGSADEEFVLRYKDAYRNGDRLPMPLVVVPYSMRHVKSASHSPCAGRHRMEAARRAGAKSATVLRAFPKHQGDVDALRDLSLFDNAANGKSISSDETYSYCAHEVIAKNGGVHEGMPDEKFFNQMLRRWERRGIQKNTLKRHVRALLAKQRCEALGLQTPAGMVELFAKLWQWSRDSGFDALAKACCASVNDKQAKDQILDSNPKRKTAAQVLADVVAASRGYGDTKKERLTPQKKVAFRCKDILTVLKELDDDMALDFATLQEVEEHIEELATEATETIARLRAKIGGLVHA